MGLRCLLGHNFSEPRTETDREERGDEVITTITEVKECARCGETRVVSENKEVTSLDHAGTTTASQGEADGLFGTADADAADGVDTENAPDTADATVASDVPDSTTAEPDAGTVEAPTETESPDTADVDAASAPEAPTDDDFDHPAADPADAEPDAEEDAEIIDGDGATVDSPDDETAGRAHGEWPDADANRKEEDRPTGQTEWPDADAPTGDDQADSQAPVDGEAEDVEILDDDPDPESAAATEARTDVVADAANADEAGVASDPADEDVEFIDGDGPGDWPDQAGDDEGYDAELDDGGESGVSVDGNLRPQVDPDVASEEDVEFIEADADAAGTPAASGHDDGQSSSEQTEATTGEATASEATESTASSQPAVELQTTVDRIETVYACPDCGLREPVGASSMRAGDICPDCKRGYIEERELE